MILARDRHDYPECDSYIALPSEWGTRFFALYPVWPDGSDHVPYLNSLPQYLISIAQPTLATQALIALGYFTPPPQDDDDMPF